MVRIRRNRAVLGQKRRVKEGVVQRSAATERRLGRELGQDKLFVAIVEHPPSHPDAGLTRTTGHLGEPTVRFSRRPGQTETGREGLPVTVGQSLRYPRISWK